MFRLYNESDAGRCLYPKGSHGQDDYETDFHLNAFEPDIFGDHPAAADCVVWEGEVGAGDIIFIPSRWPHAVSDVYRANNKIYINLHIKINK